MSRIDWLEPEPEGNHAWTFWLLAQSYALKRYAHYLGRANRVTSTDLQVAATDALLTLARQYGGMPDSLDKEDKKIFWHFAKQRIAWAISDLVSSREGLEFHLTSIVDGEEQEVWTQLRQPARDSLLQDQLVDFIETMHPVEQLTLALRFYEEMRLDEVAAILGTAKQTQHRRTQDATYRVLHTAITLAGDGKLPPLKPTRTSHLTGLEGAASWAQGRYGCTLEAYLQRVLADFRLDVGYLTDMLISGNGTRLTLGRPQGEQSARAKLTNEQVADVRDRVEAGERRAEIAASYGVDVKTISNIVNGKTYLQVA